MGIIDAYQSALDLIDDVKRFRIAKDVLLDRSSFNDVYTIQEAVEYCTDILQKLTQGFYNPSADDKVRLDVKIGWSYHLDPWPITPLESALFRIFRLRRSSFKEADLNVESVRKYMMKNHWIETEIDQYVLFFEPRESDPENPKMCDKTIRVLLDPNMEFKEIMRHERTCLHMGYSRSNRENHDMRIEIYSVNDDTELTTTKKELFLNRKLITKGEARKAGNESISIPKQPASFGFKIRHIRHHKMSSFSPPNAGKDLKSKFLVVISENTSFSNLQPESIEPSERLTSVNLRFDHENFKVLDCIKDPKFFGAVSELVDDIF